ncbi:MAG: L,D-transpeptidase family protein [Acetobacteraceae bacterium]|nr:L,D-transpeptidase family protein [Acetobacteraceae bacterium]
MSLPTRRALLAATAGLTFGLACQPRRAAAAAVPAQLRERMARAAEDGLDPTHYAAPDDPAAQAEALGRFARDLGFGRIQELAGRPDILRAEVPGPAALAAMILAAADPVAALDSLAPRTPLYVALKAELARLRTARWPSLEPSGRTINPGARDAQVAVLRARLAASDPSIGPTRDPEFYDPALVAAARRFQAAHGLDADGKLGRYSQALLAETPAARAGRAAASMDLLRAPAAAEPELAIEVNIPAYRFVAAESGHEVLAMKVVVGKPARPTPLMQTRMISAVFNPPWGVPMRLAREDLLPRLRADPSAVAARGFRIYGAGGVEVDPTTVNWRSVREDRFPFVIRQDPGDANALGRIKFNLVNELDIYMHDTPDRRYFATDVRAFSSGCIRLERPLEMYDLLFAGQSGMDRARLQALLDRRTTSSMAARRAIPVNLVYRTAALDGAGRLLLRHDIYGHDAAYARAMAQPTTRAA